MQHKWPNLAKSSCNDLVVPQICLASIISFASLFSFLMLVNNSPNYFYHLLMGVLVSLQQHYSSFVIICPWIQNQPLNNNNNNNNIYIYICVCVCVCVCFVAKYCSHNVFHYLYQPFIVFVSTFFYCFVALTLFYCFQH
jgi:hypothetical protein